MFGLGAAEEGTWQCVECGERREEVRYLGVTVLVGEPKPPGRRRTEVSASCERDGHDWKPEGCHSIGLSTTACCYPI